MDLILVRHAIAEDRERSAAGGLADRERRLTARGRAKMKRAARGLAALVGNVDLVATSPFERARATADLVAKAMAAPPPVSIDALIAGRRPGGLLRWLARQGEKRIVLVGHEPDLGRLAALLVGGEGAPPLAIRKGGACLLRTPCPARPGGAELRWFLPPSVLRSLAG